MVLELPVRAALLLDSVVGQVHHRIFDVVESEWLRGRPNVPILVEVPLDVRVAGRDQQVAPDVELPPVKSE